MKQLDLEILSNHKLARGFNALKLRWTHKDSIPLPGQFFTVRGSSFTDPLLRRPFAFSGFNQEEKSAEMIFQQKGKATTLLAGTAVGSYINIIGPLGNSFPLPQGKYPLLIAGGIGLGPILFFSHWLKERGYLPLVILGFRDRTWVPPFPGRLGFNPLICTENGSLGFHGNVVDYLRTLPKERIHKQSAYACGPFAMMEACHRFFKPFGMDFWVSMEQTMACGVGACMGCAIELFSSDPNEKTYQRVCSEGPVFNSKVIKWTSQ